MQTRSACACNYTYLQNLIKLRPHCLIKLLYCSLHCWNKGLLIRFGKLNFKQYSATSNKHLKQLQYAHSQVTNCGPKSILLLLLVVEGNWFDHFTSWNVTNDLQSASSKTLLDELTVVLLVKIPAPSVKLSSINACTRGFNCAFPLSFRTPVLCHAVCRYPPLGTWYVLITSVNSVVL